MQRLVKRLNKTDSDERLHDYFIVSSQLAYKPLERVLGINKSSPRGTPRTYRLLHAHGVSGCTLYLPLGQRNNVPTTNQPASYREDKIPYSGEKSLNIAYRANTEKIYVPYRTELLPICRIPFTDTIPRNSFLKSNSPTRA